MRFLPDGKEVAFLNGIGKYVIAGKAPVSHEDWVASIGIAVDQLAKSSKFAF